MNKEPIETGIPGVKLKPGGSIKVSGDAKITFKTDGKEHVIQNTTMTYEEMLEVAAQREAENKAWEAVDKLYKENGDALQQLAEIEMEEYTDEQIKQWNEDD